MVPTAESKVSGDSIAHYEIGAKLGEGGMGEVYRATDTKLHREVALKVLPPDFTEDPERLERFRREARALAAFSHPNIGGIHGIEEADGRVALVLELIEGPTLADKLAAGPLPLEEVLPIAEQMAVALEAAHERGIVHRDLKPANVKITSDGQVKVLDFGLAKTIQRDDAGADVTQSPTALLSAMTPGMVLGTAAYMAPEQAKGDEVDRRADIWAYGATLFEMITGRRLFEGDDLTEVMAAVISTEPDLSRLPDELPGWLRDLIVRCLRRDVSMRLPDIAAARIALQEAGERGDELLDTTGPRPGGAPWALVPLALAAGVLLAVFTLRGLPGADPTGPVTFSEIVFDPPPIPTAQPVWSPDGRTLAYVGGDDDHAEMIYVRSLDDGSTRPLSGSEFGWSPSFSPDGRSLAFVAAGRLLVSALDGLPEALATAAGTASGTLWLPDDTIVFSTVGNRLLQRIPASGGTPEPVEVSGADTEALWFSDPGPLPDPQTVLVSVRDPQAGGPRIGAVSLRDGTFTPIARGSSPRFVAPSTLVFLQRRALVGASFDPDSLELTGPEHRLEPPGSVLVTEPGPGGDRMIASVPPSGQALFPMDTPEPRRLVWVDRDGSETPTGFVFDGGTHLSFAANGAVGASLSPDGTSVALIADNAPLIVELDELERRRALPRVGTSIAYPRWHPSGDELILSGNATGAFGGYRLDISGRTPPKIFTRSPQSIPTAFFPDRESMIGYVVTPAGRDLWIFRLDGDDKPLLETPANERAPALAPDGRAYAYISNKSGEDVVYLRLHPDVGQSWPISDGGASAPLWSRDGTEVYFLQENRMMAVAVEIADGLRTGTATELFPTGPYEKDAFGNTLYDVADDGRFLIVRRGTGAHAWRRIQNWGSALQEMTRE